VLLAKLTATDIESFQAARALVLRPLDEGPLTCFQDLSPTDQDTTEVDTANTYERVIEVRGHWPYPAAFAVFAEWQVADPEKFATFEESRRDLFEARREHLPTFASDWLLRHTEIQGRYLVIGLYGDKEGAARLCRLHPEVLRFAEAHPPDLYSATAISGLHVFRVERCTI